MWEREDALTEEERNERIHINVVDYNTNVMRWDTYCKTNTLSPGGIGRDRPKVKIELNSKVACYHGSRRIFYCTNEQIYLFIYH